MVDVVQQSSEGSLSTFVARIDTAVGSDAMVGIGTTVDHGEGCSSPDSTVVQPDHGAGCGLAQFGAMERLSIRVERVDRPWVPTVVVTLCGVVDQHTAQLMSDAIREVRKRRPALLILDMSQVGVFDEACLAVLCAVAHALALGEGRLCTVASPGQGAFEIITARGYGERLALYPSAQDALTMP